jgi:mono/diheme cytochrome c family protein
MKKFSLVLVASLVLGSFAFAAEDGAAIFKSKCAMCHGAEGQGKIGPKLQGTQVPEAQIVDMLTNGVAGKKAPHSKPLAGLTKEQAQAVATHVKGLK